MSQHQPEHRTPEQRRADVICNVQRLRLLYERRGDAPGMAAADLLLAELKKT